MEYIFKWLAVFAAILALSAFIYPAEAHDGPERHDGYPRPPHPEQDCKLQIEQPGEQGATYEWLLFRPGNHYGGKVTLTAGQAATCKALGIESKDFHAARYVYVKRTAPRESMQTFRETPNGAICGMDLNGDGVVNHYESGVFKRHFLAQAEAGEPCGRFLCKADFSGNGALNFFDFYKLRQAQGQSCTDRNSI